MAETIFFTTDFTNKIKSTPESTMLVCVTNSSGATFYVPISYFEAAVGSVNSIANGTNISVDSTNPEIPIVSVIASPTFTTVTATTFKGSVAAAHLEMAGTAITAAGTDANINASLEAKGASGQAYLSVNGNAILLCSASAWLPGVDNSYDVGSASLGIRTAYINTTKTNKITELTALAGVTITTNSVDRWIFNASGAFNPYTDNTNDIGNHTVNPRDIHASRNFALKGIAAEGAGGWTHGYVTSSTTFTGGATENIAVQVPNNSKITGVLLRVDVDITFGGGGVSWSAAYNTGATQSITTAQVPTKNTKVKTFFDSNAASPITTAATDITITPDAGTLATGAITAIVFYESLTNLTDAA